MPFGQLAIGPPGSGKSTYCYGMFQFLSAIGRKASVVNLDPANDKLPYPCALDIRDFVTIEEVMEEQQLGPNGGMIYAIEELDQSVNEFLDRIKAFGPQEYVLFDCPGQVELFTHHTAIQRIFKLLEKELQFRLCVVHLIDSFYITSPSQYISILLLALRSMLQLDLPHINVLSKIDLLSNYGELPFNLDFYTEVQDVSYLFPLIEKESPTLLGAKYAKLTEAIAEVVEEFGLVAFEVLAVEDKNSMISLLTVIDRATGYLFGSTEISGDTVWADATRQGGTVELADIQERWIDYKEEYDQAEREKQEKLRNLENDGQNNNPLTEEEEWEQAVQEWEQIHGRPLKKSL